MIPLVEMVVKIASAVRAYQQAGEHIGFAILTFALAPFTALFLNLLPTGAVNKRFMHIAEDHHVLGSICNPFLILVGLAVGFEVDQIAAIFLRIDDFDDRPAPPNGYSWDLSAYPNGEHRCSPNRPLEKEHPLVQTGEIKNANLYITQHTQEYGEFGLKQSKLWDKDTLCITIAANIAETALLSYPMCFPDSVVGFKADKTVSSELFMYYVFGLIRHSIQNAATGSTQDNINIDYLTSLDFKLPSKEYQDRIVTTLSSIDKKILSNEKINDNLAA